MCAGLWAAAGSAATTNDHRIALVIGNADYQFVDPLQNPVNDARAMSAALRDLGFDVISAENTSKKDLEFAVLDFAGKLRRDSVGLFYYAGHGMQARGRNFLIPVDAQIPTQSRLRVSAVDINLVLEEMGLANNRLNIVILDACRNNPFEGKFRGAGKGLAAVDAARGMMIAYATAPGAIAADGVGANGLYTSHLLTALKVPGLKVEEVFKQVRIGVARETQSQQVPWESSSLTGDFVFNLDAPVSPGRIRSGEVVFWQSIQQSRDPADFEAYLVTYPNGTFAPLARNHLSRLTPPDVTPREAPIVVAKATPPRVARPSTAPARDYRVALMPIAVTTQVFYSEAPLAEAVLGAANGEQGVNVVSSFYRDRAFYDEVDVDTYWNPGAIHRTPNSPAVLGLAERHDFDAVLMIWYEPIGTFIDPDGNVMTNPIEVFLVDRHRGDVRSLKGTYAEAEELTAKLLAGVKR